MPAPRIAHFQMVDAQRLSQSLRLRLERDRSYFCHRGNATIYREWERHQRIAEQKAVHMGERQNTLQHTILLRIEEVGAMPEHVGNDFLPPGPVKKRRPFAGMHKRIPTPRSGAVIALKSLDRRHRFLARPATCVKPRRF